MEDATAFSNFLRKNPPLGGLQELTRTQGNQLVHVRRRLSQSTPTHEEQHHVHPLPKFKPQAERHTNSVLDFRDRVLHSSRRLKAGLLFRIAGSTLPVAKRFAALMLIISPILAALMHNLFRLGGVSPLYWLSAFSTVVHFLVLPFLAVSLSSHCLRFGTKWSIINESFTGNLPKLAMLIQARCFAGFVVSILSLVGVGSTVWDQGAAATIGLVLMLRDILEGRYNLEWVRLIRTVRERRALTVNTPTLIVIVLAAYTAVTYLWIKTTQDVALIQILSSTVLSPWPTLGFAESYFVTKPTMWLIIRVGSLLGLTWWFHSWISHSTAQFSEALKASMVADHRDLLLTVNGRSWPEQFAFMAHIVSVTQGIPQFLPLASAVVFTPYDVSESCFQDETKKKPALISTAERNAYYVPTSSVLHIPDFYTHAIVAQPKVYKLGPPRPSSTKPEWSQTIRSAPYRALDVMLSSAIHALPPVWLSAIHLTLCQSAPSNWLAKAVCWLIDDRTFLGRLPCDFTRQQVELLVGYRRNRFFSLIGDQESMLLSCEAGELIFGDQLFPAFVSRLSSLSRSAEKLLYVVETLTTSAATGVAVVCDPTRPHHLTPARKQEKSVYRFDPKLTNDLETAVAILLGDNPQISQLRDQLTRYLPKSEASVWLQFSDGTKGLPAVHRRALLRLCQECLCGNLQVIRIGYEAMRHLVRARSHFYSVSGRDAHSVLPVRPPGALDKPLVPCSLTNQADVNDKLRKHFPSLIRPMSELVAGEAAGGTSPLQDLICAVKPVREGSLDFATIPHNPPHAVVDERLAHIAAELGQYLEIWLNEMTALQHCTMKTCRVGDVP